MHEGTLWAMLSTCITYHQNLGLAIEYTLTLGLAYPLYLSLFVILMAAFRAGQNRNVVVWSLGM
jgi:hypothetical protein